MEEYELITDKLAEVRDNLFDESDFVSNDGYDLLSSYVGSPYEVLCGMEQKILRQQKELDNWKELFYLLYNDHIKLENYQTEEWKIKAKKMGLNY